MFRDPLKGVGGLWTFPLDVPGRRSTVAEQRALSPSVPVLGGGGVRSGPGPQLLWGSEERHHGGSGM